jgi:hypothetical protein
MQPIKPRPMAIHVKQALEDLISSQRARETALALAAEAKSNFDAQVEEVRRCRPRCVCCACLRGNECGFTALSPFSTSSHPRVASSNRRQVAMLKQRLSELSVALDNEQAARQLAANEAEARWAGGGLVVSEGLTQGSHIHNQQNTLTNNHYPSTNQLPPPTRLSATQSAEAKASKLEAENGVLMKRLLDMQVG